MSEIEVEFEELCEFGDDPIEEHYESIVNLPSWKWIDGDGIYVDLRHISRYRKIYANNMLDWMIDNHSPNTPYMDTKQFEYLSEKMRSFAAKCNQVKKMFRKGNQNGL